MKQTLIITITRHDPLPHVNRLSNRDFHCEIYARSKEGKSKAKPLQSSAKLDETMAKNKINLATGLKHASKLI
jgi:hypothetical protein